MAGSTRRTHPTEMLRRGDDFMIISAPVCSGPKASIPVRCEPIFNIWVKGWVIVFVCHASRPCSWLEDDSIQCYATNWLVFVSRCRTWPVLVMARVVAVAELPYAGPVY